MLAPDNNGSGPRKRSTRGNQGESYLLEPDINGTGGVTESDSDSELKKANDAEG